MRVMDVLPAYEIGRYNSPPNFSAAERKQYFQMDESIKNRIGAAKSQTSKLGLLLQAGYLEATGRFFAVKTFKVADMKFAAKQLGIAYRTDLISGYNDRTRQTHRELLLDLHGLQTFDSAKSLVIGLVQDMVSQQMHPRKMLYAINKILRRKKIELPSYSAIARLISKSFNQFEANKLKTLATHITTEQTEALRQLIEKADVPYERTLLTRLKKLLRSVKPRKIQEGVRNFLIIKKLFFELLPVIEQLDLSSEATHYYASWVSKAKLSQITEMTDCHKQYLHLTAFISHYYRQWQDCLVDTLLKSVQQQLNKSEQLLLNLAQERLPEQRQLTTSVLAGFNHHKATVESVRSVLYRNDLSAEEKLQQMQMLLPKAVSTKTNADAAADKLNAQLQENKERKDEFDILDELSRKLQNRVALLVKHLNFDLCSNEDDLAHAILHYQQHSNINGSAPIAAMDNNEINAIHRDGKFNTSLYKAILFCKVANAVKRGQINLKYSYRYLSCPFGKAV